MIEYLVFFGLLAAGFLAYMYRPQPEPVVSDRIKCESPIERRLYDALVFRGYAVTPQVPCGRYRIDLALVGPMIAIECDGKAYHSSKKDKARDRRKDAYLREHGWTVMRFSGRQITSRLPDVLRRIDAEV